MGNTARLLSSMAFYAASGSGNFGNMSIFLAHTSATNLSTTFANNYSGNHPTEVFFSASLPLNSTPPGWKPIILDTPFAYNGTDNLLIEIRWSGSATTLDTRATAETGWKRTLLGGTVNATLGTLQGFRNVLQFAYTADAVYTISGTVRDSNNTPVQGVRLYGLPGNPLTDANGFYSAAVPAGWSGSAYPVANNYIFDKAHMPYTSVSSDQLQQNYTELSIAGLEIQSTSATYSDGDIPTDLNFQSLPGTSRNPGSLTVSLPSDAVITGVDVAYTMTAQNGGYMGSQRSWLRCIAYGGRGEDNIATGRDMGGTYTYARTGLSIAHGVRGGGDITFELHAGRIAQGTGVCTTYNKVDNNTWVLTVNYVQVSMIPPINVSTESLEITEGQTAQFFVSLGNVPESDVTVDVIRVSGSTNILVQSANPLVFTPANGTNALPVTIYASPDANWTNDVAVFVCVDPSGTYADSPPITVTELDVNVDPSTLLPFHENFDDSDKASVPGPLNGQHGWQSGGGGAVEAGVGLGGSNALRLVSDYAEHDFINGTNQVAISLWMQAVGGEDPSVPAELSAAFWVDTNNFVRAYSNQTIVVLPVQVTPGAYSHFEAWVDYSAGTWRLDVNGTTAFHAFGTYSSQPAFTKLLMENTSTDPAYFDDIHITSGPAEPLTAFEQWLVLHGLDAGTCETEMCVNGVNTLRDAYIAGLDPSDPQSRFEIGHVGGTADDPVLQWTGVTGRLYSVYWSSNLLHGAAGFELLASDIPWNSTTFTDTVHRASEKGFYRINVQLAE